MVGFQISDALYIGYGYDHETTKLNNYNSGSHEIFKKQQQDNNPKILLKKIIMKKNLLLLIIVSVFSFSGSAQNEKNYITQKISDKYAYIDVIKTYERVAAKGYKSVDLFQKLGNSYYSNSKLEKAATWYCELFAMTSDLEPVYYYRYAESLRFIGQNDKADAVIEKLKHNSKVLAKNKV